MLNPGSTVVKNPLAMQEMWVQSLRWKDPLGKKKWQPTPVILPGESHGQRNLAGYSPQVQSEMQLSMHARGPFAKMENIAIRTQNQSVVMELMAG